MPQRIIFFAVLLVTYRFVYVRTLLTVTRLVFTLLLRDSRMWPPRFGEPRWQCFAALDCAPQEVVAGIERAWILSVVSAAFLVALIVAHCVLGAPVYMLLKRRHFSPSRLAAFFAGVLVAEAVTFGVPVEEWAWSRHWLVRRGD